MRFLSAFAAVMVAAPALALADPLPSPGLVLFWADWCAPCQAELRGVEAIARVAGPVPVVVVPLSATRALPPGFDRRRLRLPDKGGWQTLADFGLPPALPAAVVLDRTGRRCAAYRGGLNAGSAAALLATCRTG